MLARARSVLPNGPVDVLRQIVLFCGAYWLYRVARGLVDSRAAEAFDNARSVIHIERDLGLFFEPAVHAWASGQAMIIDASSWMYLNSHFVVTTVTLAWIYLRRNERFYFVRNMFMVAMAIALVGYVAVPTAPPRFMPEWGFGDSVAAFTGVHADSGSADLLFNRQPLVAGRLPGRRGRARRRALRARSLRAGASRGVGVERPAAPACAAIVFAP